MAKDLEMKLHLQGQAQTAAHLDEAALTALEAFTQDRKDP